MGWWRSVWFLLLLLLFSPWASWSAVAIMIVYFIYDYIYIGALLLTPQHTTGNKGRGGKRQRQKQGGRRGREGRERERNRKRETDREVQRDSQQTDDVKLSANEMCEYWTVFFAWSTLRCHLTATWGQRTNECRRWGRFDSPVQQGTFLPQSTFSAGCFTCVRTPPCAMADMKTCKHVQDPVVHVRARWIMQTLKHPACTEGWVAPPCRCWLSLGIATRIFHGGNANGTIQLFKKNGRGGHEEVNARKQKSKIKKQL